MQANRIYKHEASLESVTRVAASRAATFEFRNGNNDVYLMTVPIDQFESLLKDPEKWLSKTFQKNE